MEKIKRDGNKKGRKGVRVKRMRKDWDRRSWKCVEDGIMLKIFYYE